MSEKLHLETGHPVMGDAKIIAGLIAIHPKSGNRVEIHTQFYAKKGGQGA